MLRGFSIVKAVEVTDQEVLSALKRDLIDRESIVSKERFCGVESRLRTLFRRPNLKLGIGAIDGERVLILNDFSSHEHSCIFADSAHHKVSEFAGTIYARAVQSGEPIIIEDLGVNLAGVEVILQLMEELLGALVFGHVEGGVQRPLVQEDVNTVPEVIFFATSASGRSIRGRFGGLSS